jgi:TctA family transporter
MDPGPTIFIKHPENIYAVFLVFILANLIMLPLGWAAIKAATQVLRVPRPILMPTILLFCVVGAYATNNSAFGILLVLVFGIAAFMLEAHGFPVAPAILGVVLGKMLEENFVTSMIKANGNAAVFFQRPISAFLGVATLVILFWPVGAWIWKRSLFSLSMNRKFRAKCGLKG